MEDASDIIRPGSGRGLDFVNLEELRKRTGIMPSDVLKFAMAEMLCNALDTDAMIIEVFLRDTPPYAELSVGDNGSTKRLSLDDIKMILDFDNKASSKRGFLRVSRGYLGNALKCIFGYSYALSTEKGITPPSIIIESNGKKYTIDLKPDRRSETIESDITESESESTLTTFTVRIPHLPLPHYDTEVLEDIIFATSMVNHDRQIHYDFFGKAVVLGTVDKDVKVLRRPTSILWYNPKQFGSLFNDYQRARPDMHLKAFISLFRTLSRKKPIRDVLLTLATALSRDSTAENDVQFVPTTPIHSLGMKDITTLYHSMREHTKPIGKRSIPSLLGSVGEAEFERLRESHDWARLRYTKIPAFRVEDKTDSVGFPYLIELAVFDRDEDGEGLKVFQCVNFAASMEDIFSRIFDIGYRLGQVGIAMDMPVTVLLHLVCPVLNWLNYGKSGLDE